MKNWVLSQEVDRWSVKFDVRDLGVSLPTLTGDMLFEVVKKKSATAGSLDGWGWRELKVLPVSWYDGLARILT